MKTRNPLPTTLLGLVVVALLAFTGTASATTLTSPSGTAYTGATETDFGHMAIHNYSLGLTYTCFQSRLKGNVEQHGPTSTAVIKLTSLSMGQCGGGHLSVRNPGSLEIHATGGGNGTVTSTGTELTIQYTALGISCLYKTTSTHLGTLTGGTPATLQLGSAIIPRIGHSVFCGSTGEWTGSYKFVTPSTLLVD